MKPTPNQPAGRHLLFIDEHLRTGGIATLIARVSRLLVADGWQVTLITKTTEDAAGKLLPAGVRMHQLHGRFKWLYFPEGAVSIAKKLGLESVTLIYATGIVASWLGTILSTWLRNHPVMVCGVYSPWEFCYPKTRRFRDYGTRMRCSHFDRGIADVSKLFMSEVVRQQHAKSLGRSLDAAPVCLLPIDARMFKNVVRRPDRFKLVSVGRLCYWKTYNLYMIQVVKELRQRGHPVHWHVYGTGELEPEMRGRIHESGLENHIHLHGNLDYQRFPDVLADAGAFVGMGTSIIEAGFARVPSVLALENAETQKTYGCLPDLPLGACGERLEHPPQQDTADLLDKLFRMTDGEYADETSRTWQFVQPFDQDHVFAQLLRCFENAQPCRASYLKFAAYNLHGVYRTIFPPRG